MPIPIPVITQVMPSVSSAAGTCRSINAMAVMTSARSRRRRRAQLPASRARPTSSSGKVVAAAEARSRAGAGWRAHAEDCSAPGKAGDQRACGVGSEHQAGGGLAALRLGEGDGHAPRPCRGRAESDHQQCDGPAPRRAGSPNGPRSPPVMQQAARWRAARTKSAMPTREQDSGGERPGLGNPGGAEADRDHRADHEDDLVDHRLEGEGGARLWRARGRARSSRRAPSPSCSASARRARRRGRASRPAPAGASPASARRALRSVAGVAGISTRLWP